MKCHLCGADVPVFGNVMWCDDCMNEFLDGRSGEAMEEFIARKKQERKKEAP